MKAARRPHVGLVIGQLTYGGAETQLCELALGLAADYRVSVYCLSQGPQPLAGRLRDGGIELKSFASRGSFDLSRVMAFRSALKKDQPQILHSFLFIASAYSYLAARGVGPVALVASARNCKIEKSRLRRMILRRAFAAAECVVCNSQEMAAFAGLHYGAPAEQTRVIYNGVDLDRFQEAAPRTCESGRVIGTVGRIEAQKNLGLFVDVAAKYLKVFPNTKFEIVGDGTLRDPLQQRINALGLAAKIRLRGTCEDVPGFLSELSQFWLTSDWEGTPNVVLEAMASSLPVVATAVGGTPELLDNGRTGYLVGAGDAQAFADAAIAASESEQAKKIGAAARREVDDRFSVAAMVRNTCNVYEEILERGGG